MAGAGSFPVGRARWLDQLGQVRNVVRQEVIARHLDKHLPAAPAGVLDVGAGQGTQALRLAAAGHRVTAVEPDPDMRAAFSTASARHRAEVRDRVELVDGRAEDLGPGIGDRTFDAVLLLGVLMYVPSTEPVLAQIASHLRPGGMAALAVRTTTSAVWRAAARQDWTAARLALDDADRALPGGADLTYVNEIGSPARAVDLDRLLRSAARHGLRLEEWYGVRIAVDMEELDPPAPRSRQELADLLDVEERLGARDPFRHLGQLCLVVLRAAGGEGADEGSRASSA